MTSLTWTSIESLSDAPSTCGVYRYMRGGDILYIGKAVNLKARLASHAQAAKLDKRERSIVEGATRIEVTLVDNEFKALLLESQLIRSQKPKYNRAWKDDKSYLYIVIDTRDLYPRPRLARIHDLQEFTHRECKSFGPFPSSRTAEEVLRAVRRLVPFCMQKTIGTRPCFYSKLGLCSPCPSLVQKLSNKDQAQYKKKYRHQIRQVIRILEGKTDPVVKELTRAITAYSRREEYEQALSLRNKLASFTEFMKTSTFARSDTAYNTSDLSLQSLLELLSPHYSGLTQLNRIECFDASNSGTASSTVSLVVATGGLLDRGQYRRFKIKSPRARSDFDRLGEALSRRLKRISDRRWPQPDLIVIDGGLPQLRRVQPLIDKLPSPIPLLGLAKRPDRLVLPSGAVLRPVANHPGLQLLESLRDEAHRFANKYRKILDKRLSFNG